MNSQEKDNVSVELYLELLKKALTASLYDESAWRIIEAEPLNAPRKWNARVRIKGWLRKLLVRQLQKRSFLLVRPAKFNIAAREGGEDWPCFGFTMIGHRRLDNLEQCVKDVIRNNVPGDLIETGAWRGGATIFMRALLKLYGDTDRVVWVADSFEGLPKPKSSEDGWDLSHVNHLRVSLDQVKANFSRFALLDDQVRFLPGWFEDTLPSAPITTLALLRLDGDLYSSTMDVLRSLYSKVSPGGYIIVDDYFGWPACKRAVDQYLEENRIKVKIEQIDVSGAFWQKQ